MINKSIRVNATASVANVSCGFDCLGFSIKSPSDIIRIEEKKTAGQLLLHEKNEVSHRGKALKKISSQLFLRFEK